MTVFEPQTSGILSDRSTNEPQPNEDQIIMIGHWIFVGFYKAKLGKLTWGTRTWRSLMIVCNGSLFFQLVTQSCVGTQGSVGDLASTGDWPRIDSLADANFRSVFDSVGLTRSGSGESGWTCRANSEYSDPLEKSGAVSPDLEFEIVFQV